MNPTDAVIQPIRHNGTPDTGSLVILVSSKNDFRSLCTGFPGKPERSSELINSRIQTFQEKDRRFSIVGPVLGAPYAALLAENCIAWGAKTLVYFGLCGSITPDVRIGDVILPEGAYIEEGTSLHYGKSTGEIAFASERALECLKAHCAEQSVACRQGRIWTTDAVFRETHELVTRYQGKKALAVEMELSALFTIGRYRRVDVGAVLVVSDELFTLSWRPGFHNKRFKTQCQTIQRMIHSLCLTCLPEK